MKEGTKREMYVFSEMGDNVGSDTVFETEEEAVQDCEVFWRHMTNRERKKMLWCHVFAINADEQDVERINSGDLDPNELWTREVYRKIFTI